MRGKSRLIPNSLALMFHTVFAAVVALVQVKILANTLDRETFGLFASLRGLSLILAILAANGVPALLLRFLPEHEARGERSRVLRISALSVIGPTVLVLLLLAGVKLLQTRVFAFAEAETVGAALFLWFAVYSLGVTIKMVVYGGLNGMRRHTVQVALELASSVLSLLLILAYRDGLTLEHLMRILGLVNFGVALFAVAIFFVWTYVTVGRNGSAPERLSANGSPAYRSYLIWASALSFVSFTFTDVDRYILAQVLALEILALLDIGLRPIRLANRFLCVSNAAFQPEVTRWIAQDRFDHVETTTRVFLKFNCMMAISVAVAIALFARDIIVAISSVDYAGATPVLIVLTLCLPLSTMTAPLTTVMKASNRVRDALISDSAWAATYVTFLFLLGSAYGLMGVGVAQVIACSVQLLTAVTRSRLRIDARFLVRLCGRLSLVATVVFAPAVIVALPGVGPGGLAGFALRGALLLFGCAVLFGGIHMWGIFDATERGILSTVLAKYSPRLARLFQSQSH